MKKYLVPLIVCLILIGISIVINLLIFTTSNSIILSINCFAIDDKELLYIGSNNSITVLQDNRIINKITINTSGSFVFTIDENNLLRVITLRGNKIYKMNLKGDILEILSDPEGHTYYELEKNKNEISRLNKTYKLKNILGYYKIVRYDNNEVVTIYKMPASSFVMKIVFTLCFISSFPIVLIFIFISRYTPATTK